MLERLLPSKVDNDYRGHALALWLFVPITIVTLGRSLAHIFLGDGGAQSIATIPLDSFSPGGSDAVITMFAMWGLSQLLIGVLYVLVLVRYRTLLPLMYLSLAFEYLGRMAIGTWKPLTTLQTPPGASANIVFSVVGIAMLILSLRNRPKTS